MPFGRDGLRHRSVLSVAELIGVHRALLHHERERPTALGHGGLRPIESGRHRIGLGRKWLPRNAHRGQQVARDLAHQLVLRLVGDTRRSAVGRDEQGRDAERVVERRERVHGIAEPRVLADHDRLSAGQVGAGRDAERLALACRADVIEVGALDDVVDERRQERARHAGPEGIAALERRLDELLGLDHEVIVRRPFGSNHCLVSPTTRARLSPVARMRDSSICPSPVIRPPMRSTSTFPPLPLYACSTLGLT